MEEGLREGGETLWVAEGHPELVDEGHDLCEEGHEV